MSWEGVWDLPYHEPAPSIECNKCGVMPGDWEDSMMWDGQWEMYFTFCDSTWWCVSCEPQ